MCRSFSYIWRRNISEVFVATTTLPLLFFQNGRPFSFAWAVLLLSEMEEIASDVLSRVIHSYPSRSQLLRYISQTITLLHINTRMSEIWTVFSPGRNTENWTEKAQKMRFYAWLVTFEARGNGSITSHTNRTTEFRSFFSHTKVLKCLNVSCVSGDSCFLGSKFLLIE